MDREALLLAAAHAASAAAAGTNDMAAQRTLEGKRFDVRIRFGCPMAGPVAPNPNEGPFNVRFDEKARTLRVRASPDLTLDDPQAAAIAGGKAEAVEGFWMYRPWLLEARCPVVPKPAGLEADAPAFPSESGKESPEPAGVRVGLAQFYTEEDARTGRRDGRPFEATKVLEADQKPSVQGYDLVLSGRLAPAPGGKIVNCRVESASAPPDCIVSADIERVRIERPGTNELVAEWSD